MSATSLVTIYDRFVSESQEIEMRFQAPTPTDPSYMGSCGVVHPYAQEMCAIRLYIVWEQFCRDLLILSAISSPVTGSGITLTPVPDLHSDIEVIKKLAKLNNVSQTNLHWGIPSDCIKYAQQLKLSNYANISAGIGLTPNPADNLRCIRNYFAHRSNDTALRLQSVAVALGLPISTGGLQIIWQLLHGGITVFASWLDELETIASLAIQ